MKKKHAFVAASIFLILPLAGCGHDHQAAEPMKTHVANTAVATRSATDSAWHAAAVSGGYATDSAARAAVARYGYNTDSGWRARVSFHILQMWVLNGRKPRIPLDSAHAASLRQVHLDVEAWLRSSITWYRKNYGVAWRPPAYYMDSSSKPLSFYE